MFKKACIRRCQKGVPLPLKSGYFSATGLSVVENVAETDMLLIITSTDNVLFNGININDLE